MLSPARIPIHLLASPAVNRTLTPGLGALMRGVAAVAFQRVPCAIPLPVPTEPRILHGVTMPFDELLAAGISASCITAVSWFYRASRRGLSVRSRCHEQRVQG